MECNIEGMREGSGGMRHFITPQGSSSLVKHFFREAKVQPKFLHHLSSLEEVVEDGKKRWKAKTDAQVEESFDLIALTMPTQQILQLLNASNLSLPNDVSQKLSDVEYSSRYALGLFYGQEVQLPGFADTAAK